MVLRNLWRRKVRTLLTVAGIAIVIAVVVALLVVADGIAGQLNDMMSGSGAEITVMQAEVADMQFSILDEEVGRELSLIPQVQWVSGLLLQITPVEKKQFFLLMGLDTSSDAFQHFRVVEGEVPKPAGRFGS